jgi:hypothetical protein
MIRPGHWTVLVAREPGQKPLRIVCIQEWRALELAYQLKSPIQECIDETRIKAGTLSASETRGREAEASQAAVSRPVLRLCPNCGHPFCIC